MRIKQHIREAVNSLMKPYHYRIVNDNTLYEWQKNPQMLPSSIQSRLPNDAADYLTNSNPRLRELQTRYSAFDRSVTTPLIWTDALVSPTDMLYFRRDSAYVYQHRGINTNVMGYALATYYVRSIDELNLLDKLEEDDYFGIQGLVVYNRYVSRDLLDSVIEMYFLEKHLNISASTNLTVLDIGAGYGRLAHRMVSALPNIAEYLCTDAYAISTFISEYYLGFRNLKGKAKVLPLDEIEHALSERDRVVDIAVSIHSFPECRIPAIEWWLALLARHRVKYLMIVPNSRDDSLRTHNGIDFSNIIEEHGYRLRAKEPKYRDPVVQQFAMEPHYHYLFELG